MVRYFDPEAVARVRRLIAVAGHAIWRGAGDPMSDSAWILQDFQFGEPPCYVEHMRAGVEEASRDPEALLVFSGGQSRPEAGPRSEAASYFWLTDHHGWFGSPEVAARATTEEFARDSFENLQFSIWRFRECTGRDPEHVTLIGWRFKERRFDLHRAAIGWPAPRYRYIGVNDPPRHEQAYAAEERTRAAWIADPAGLAPEFEIKREARNPFRRRHPYRQP